MDHKQKDLDYATLILRVALGVFFAVAGLAQLTEAAAGLRGTVSGFAIVGTSGVISMQAALIPWIELILGVLLIAGLATSVVGAIVALLAFVFASTQGFITGTSLAKELMFVAVGLALMLLGSGNISLDAKIHGKR